MPDDTLIDSTQEEPDINANVEFSTNVIVQTGSDRDSNCEPQEFEDPFFGIHQLGVQEKLYDRMRWHDYYNQPKRLKKEIKSSPSKKNKKI